MVRVNLVGVGGANSCKPVNSLELGKGEKEQLPHEDLHHHPSANTQAK
jgi:hypothetical protein